MRRQHRQLAQAQDQQRIAGALEDKANTSFAENVDAADILQYGAIVGVALFLEQTIGECYVLGGDLPAVVKACLGAQVEDYPAAIVGKLQAFGDQTVGGVGLVAGRVIQAAADHQWLVQLTDAELGKVAGVDRAGALEGIGVQGIEGAAAHDPQGAPLRCVRVDIVEVLEVFRVAGLTVEGVAVLAIQRGPAG